MLMLVGLELVMVEGGSLIQVCKFILASRAHSHIGRGNAKVHFGQDFIEVT